MDHKGLAESDDTLLSSRNGALEHEVVVLDNAIVREATHWGDNLLRDVRFGRCVSFIVAGTDTVDLLVELSTVVVTVY